MSVVAPHPTQTARIGPSDRVLQSLTDPDVNEELRKLLSTLLTDRPRPLRKFDQIHMHLEDLAAHIQFVAPTFEGREVFVMGDSDGLVLGLAGAAVLGLVPSPKRLVLCDFDMRVVRFVSRMARSFKLERLVSADVYNVFEALPEAVAGRHDAFHTNPPYGQFNGGRSVLAFFERCVAACHDDSHGVVVLANDPRFPWTQDVLRSVLADLVERGVTPGTLIERCHRYDLDDQPDLESGVLLCRDLSPAQGLAFDEKLPASWAERFYGRKTVPIPKYISAEGEEQLTLDLQSEVF